MANRTAVLTILVSLMARGTGYGQQCLHGPDETVDEATRRREALTATRTVNNIQANQPGAAKGQYLRHEELAGSPFAADKRQRTSETMKRISLGPEAEILPNWKLSLEVTERGYWFMIKDLADPCGFAYISNQAGVIFRAEPIR
jgi:hypothetical protein